MVRRSESLSQGYRLTAASLPCPGCSFGTYGREDRGRTSGTTVVEGFRSWQKIPLRSITLETFCGAETTTQAGGSFFLYEKSVLRESDCLRGSDSEVCTDSTPTPFPPLKNYGFQGDLDPRCAASGASRRLEGRALEVFPFKHTETERLKTLS